MNDSRYGKSKSYHPFLKNGWFIYSLSIIIVFILISVLTTVKPAYRLSSKTITNLTSEVDSSVFLWLMGLENRMLLDSLEMDQGAPSLSKLALETIMHIKPYDFASLLQRETPGLALFNNQIVVAGEGTNYANLSFESSPPLEDVLKDRIAVDDEEEKEVKEEEPKIEIDETARKTVFIYNTHNRESFLPHLPDTDDPNSAYHQEVNIEKVSDHFAKILESRGIGTIVDKTDYMQMLQDKGWNYSQSYKASRETVAEAVANEKDVQYLFDIHRDSLPRNLVTAEIDGESYAKLLFVVGAEHPNYEKNLALATKLNSLIEAKHKQLTRGVITKKGAGSNGIYNQDLSDNAVLIEFGGYENTLDELYRTVEIVGEVFSDFYWEAEKVDANP